MEKNEMMKELEGSLRNALTLIEVDKKIICNQAIEIRQLKYKLKKASENKTQNNDKEWSNLEEI